MRERCATCGKPAATEADWRDMREGEGEWLCWGDPFICRPPAAEESRARAIRAVVAAQWMVACALATRLWDDSFQTPVGIDAKRVAALPTPEQIVDGIGGGR